MEKNINELLSLKIDKQKEILNIIIKNTNIIDDKNLKTDNNKVKEELIDLNLSLELIKLITSKQIDIRTFDMVKHGSWQYESRHWYDGGYKSVIRWNWWTWVTAFWNLEVNDTFCETIFWASVGTDAALETLIKIFDKFLPNLPIKISIKIFVKITVGRYAHVFKNGKPPHNGVYTDWESLVITLDEESTLDWRTV